MDPILERYLPPNALSACLELISSNGVHLKIVNQRLTRHGDYKRLADGSHQITVNATPNPYRFLITLLHEIAHLIAFEKCGRRIKPHGTEWKRTFQGLMLPFLRPEIFPTQLLPYLAAHFRNPKASSSTDTKLSLALKNFDSLNQKNCIYELPAGSVFRLYNGKLYTKGQKRVKKYECREMGTGKVYLFQPHAEVELIREHG